MADALAASDPDRLPWLADDRPASRAAGAASRMLWLAAAALLLAGASFWLGMNSARKGPNMQPAPLPEPGPMDPSAKTEPAAPLVQPSFKPQAEPASAPPQVRIAAPASPGPKSAASESSGRRAAPPGTGSRAVGTKPERTSPPSSARAGGARARSEAAASARPDLRTSWQSAGAAGRMVRIGTFATRRQAKRGWVRIVQAYSGMSGLPAVVVGSPSLRNGRTYYRLQIGTSSHAHSEILCQRMKIVGQSCVVVGLGQAGAAQ